LQDVFAGIGIFSNLLHKKFVSNFDVKIGKVNFDLAGTLGLKVVVILPVCMEVAFKNDNSLDVGFVFFNLIKGNISFAYSPGVHGIHDHFPRNFGHGFLLQILHAIYCKSNHIQDGTKII
jgi:hypothetical protein